jgi:hypothetical protein
MARYDRLREEGTSPLDAMHEVALLFVRAPYARPGGPGSRRLEIGAGPGNTDTASVDNYGPEDRNAVRLAAESFPGTVADGSRPLRLLEPCNILRARSALRSPPGT